MSKQMTYVCLEDLVPQDHPYRLMMKQINFDKLACDLAKFDNELGRNGYEIIQMFIFTIYQ